MGRVKELLFTEMYEEVEKDEETLINDIDKQIDEVLKLIKNKDFPTAKEISDDLNFRLEEIEEYVLSLEDEANEYDLYISNYDNRLASNQCSVDDDVFSEDELYSGLDDISIRDEYSEKLDEVSSKLDQVKSRYEELIERNEELTNSLIELEDEYNEATSKLELAIKGKKGEEAFMQWLNENNFSFIYVNQDQATFAKLFKNSVKRPDFLILIDGIGLIAVDIKNVKEYGSGYSLPISRELKKTLTFERTFRIPVWYVYANDQKFDKWFWINSLKIVEIGNIKTNSRTKEEFYLISKKHFTEIKDNNDFGKLWTQRLACLENVNKL